MTGEKIGDAYFRELHELRNDAAQEKRRSGFSNEKGERKRGLPQQSMDGCESMSNDKRAMGRLQ